MSKLIYVPAFHVTHEKIENIKLGGVYISEVKVSPNLFGANYKSLHVYDIPYVFFSWVDNYSGILTKEVFKVDSWAHTPGESTWELKAINYAYDGELASLMDGNFEGLSSSYVPKIFEDELLSAASKQEWSRKPPEAVKLSLGEAAEAVAAKFDVDVSKVKITVTN